MDTTQSKISYDPALANEKEYVEEPKGVLFHGSNGYVLDLPCVLNDKSDEELFKKRQQIADAMAVKKAANVIVLKRAETRNIIFLGRSRSGKSTALRTLKFPYGFPEGVSLFAETTEPTLHTFTVEYTDTDTHEQTNFNVNIMDTPGLFENSESGKKRTNAVLKEMISDCLAFEITQVHALFFLCSFTAGIDSQDIQAIIEMNEMFKGADKVFNLVITRCEGSSNRAELEKQVRSIPQLAQFFSNSNVKLFFMGALEKDDFLMGVKESVESKLDNILNMRQVLYKHIIETKTKCHLREMEIFKRTHQTVEDMEAHVTELTKQVQSYAGTMEERAKLQEELKLKTNELSNATGVLARITGQDRLRVLEGIVEDARKASVST